MHSLFSFSSWRQEVHEKIRILGIGDVGVPLNRPLTTNFQLLISPFPYLTESSTRIWRSLYDLADVLSVHAGLRSQSMFKFYSPRQIVQSVSVCFWDRNGGQTFILQILFISTAAFDLLAAIGIAHALALFVYFFFPLYFLPKTSDLLQILENRVLVSNSL